MDDSERYRSELISKAKALADLFNAEFSREDREIDNVLYNYIEITKYSSTVFILISDISISMTHEGLGLGFFLEQAERFEEYLISSLKRIESKAANDLVLAERVIDFFEIRGVTAQDVLNSTYSKLRRLNLPFDRRDLLLSMLKTLDVQSDLRVFFDD